MKRPRKQVEVLKVAISICVALTVGLSASAPSLACSGSIDPVYSYFGHPDFPLKNYAAGSLGVVHPEFARSYLLVAYRYLSSAPLTVPEQSAIVSLWDSRLSDTAMGLDVDTSEWLAARQKVPGATGLKNLPTEKSISSEESWENFSNCQGDAFVTAVKTLKQLIDKFGAGSQPVKQWLEAQDDVFSNCGDPVYGAPAFVNIPAALPASADPLLIADRAYQIAAAQFYAKDFSAARKSFEAIASNSSSPWKELSGYLAIRSMIREATLAKTCNNTLLTEAQKRLKALAVESSYASMKDDITGLANYIEARLEPNTHVELFAKAPITKYNADELTKTVDRIVGDTFDDRAEGCKYANLPAALKAQDVTDWIMDVQSVDAAGKNHALERYQQTHSKPWLVAALIHANGNDKDAASLISECEKELNGPGKWTLQYNINRLNFERGKYDLVRASIDKILSNSQDDLTPSTVNLFQTQRMLVAETLDEFAKFAAQSPNALIYSGGVEGVPDDVDKLEKSAKPAKLAKLFTPEAGYVIDSKLPLSLRIALGGKTSLPKDLRYHLLWTSWVRAILVEDDASARTLAQMMKPMNAAKSKLLDAYLTAATPAAKKFAAAFLILQFSSASPNCESGPLQDDGFGDSSGWWWSASPIPSSEETDFSPSVLVPRTSIRVHFVTKAEETNVKSELARLAKVPVAPNYLSQIVLNWAKAQPGDERIPQALHYAVSATHYGATDKSTSQLSKDCFHLLHSKYKGNSWTNKTPYFY